MVLSNSDKREAAMRTLGPRSLSSILVTILKLAGAFVAIGVVLPPYFMVLHDPVDLQQWFLIFVIIVLAEVFRIGATLRKDSELTV
jgi:hypothetical protein